MDEDSQVTMVPKWFEQLRLAVLWCRPDGSLAGLTPAAAELLGYASPEAAQEAGASPSRVWEFTDAAAQWLSRTPPQKDDLRQFRLKRQDETLQSLFLYKPAVQPGSADVGMLCLLAMDATEAEERLAWRLQTARCESVASTSGAIGHKLNNLLAGLLGYLSLMRRSAAGGSEPGNRYLDALDETGRRINELTRHLMVAAQKNISYSMQPIDPSVVVAEAVEKVKQAKREVPIALEPPAELPSIEADKAGLEEALEHLIVGVMLVLPGMIRVSVAARVEEIEAERAELFRLVPGRYLLVRVLFDHAPVREIVRERLFDPYFTVDGKGKGAELTLSRARGIIVLHKGTVIVTSRGTHRTQLEVLLPVK